MGIETIAAIAGIVGAAGSLAATGYQLAQGKPKLPEFPKPGAIDPAEAARAQAMAKALKQRRGRASTILSGTDTGATLGTGTQGPKQLLGL